MGDDFPKMNKEQTDTYFILSPHLIKQMDFHDIEGN